MRAAIIGAMKEEVASLVSCMAVDEIVEKAGKTVYLGSLRGCPVAVVQCGVGKVAAAGVAQLVISEFGATHVFNTGLAGGLKKGIKVGDIVLSAETEYFDVTPASVLKNNFPAEGRYIADKQLLALAKKAVLALGLSEITHEGLVTTGDAFITESAEKMKLLQKTTGVCNDMEGGAIAQICYGNGVPFLIVRIISDLADDTAKDTYFDFKAKAPKLCNDVICELVADLGKEA